MNRVQRWFVIAAVVFGVGCGDDGDGAGEAAAGSGALGSPSTKDTTATANLAELNGSGITGQVTFTVKANGDTSVNGKLTQCAPDKRYYIEIYEGTSCSGVDETWISSEPVDVLCGRNSTGFNVTSVAADAEFGAYTIGGAAMTNIVGRPVAVVEFGVEDKKLACGLIAKN